MDRFVLLLLLGLPCIHSQTFPDTTFLRTVNCDGDAITSGSCSSITTPLANIRDSTGDDYPAAKFCMIRDLSMTGTGDPVTYTYTGSVCSGYASFAGGIFFNYQDDDNYDAFFVKDEDDTLCYVGYVEGGNDVTEIDSFTCKDGSSDPTWMLFEVTVENSMSTTVRLGFYDGSFGSSYTYTAHFATNPEAGPLHINDYGLHGHIHFAEASMIVTPVTTEAPTGSPGVVQPEYRIRMAGDFFSTEGTDFTSACAETYSGDMSNKVQLMANVVNNLIGATLCRNVTAQQISVGFTSGHMTFEGDHGHTQFAHDLEVSTDLYISEIEVCVAEVKAFLLPQDNWGPYVLPPVAGCPTVNFTGTHFTDQTDYWVCSPETQSSDPGHTDTVTPPSYELKHSGNFDVANGESLSEACEQLYRAVLADNSNAAVAEVNNPGGAHLCGSFGVTLSLEAMFMGTDESQGHTTQEYSIVASGDMKFSDMATCAAAITAHLQDHDNWDDPIIGCTDCDCPAVTFDPAEFTLYEEGWECLEFPAVGTNDKAASQSHQSAPKPQSHQKAWAKQKTERNLRDIQSKMLKYFGQN